MPLYEYDCPACKTVINTVKSYDERNSKEECPKCGTEMQRVYTAAGGYRIKGNNSASVTPRGSGSFRRKK